jgi:hypothetical protein
MDNAEKRNHSKVGWRAQELFAGRKVFANYNIGSDKAILFLVW